MKTLRKSLVVVLIALFSLCTLTVFGLSKTVKAEETVFAMDYGAYARVKANAEDFGGLRFRVKFSNDVKTEIDKDNVILNFTLMTKDYYDAIDGKDTFEYAEAVESGKVWQLVADESLIYYGSDAKTDDAFYFSNLLVKANPTYYGQEFFAIASIYDGEKYTYADYIDGSNSKSLYGVVNSAVLGGQADIVASSYEWFGNEEYPVVIANGSDYNSLKTLVNGGDSFFKDKKFNIAKEVVVKQEDFTGFNEEEFKAFAENSNIPTYIVKYAIETSVGSGVYNENGQTAEVITNDPESVISSFIIEISGNVYETFVIDEEKKEIILKYVPIEEYIYSVKYFVEDTLGDYTENTSIVKDPITTDDVSASVENLIEIISGFEYYGYKVDNDSKVISLYYVPAGKYIGVRNNAGQNFGDAGGYSFAYSTDNVDMDGIITSSNKQTSIKVYAAFDVTDGAKQIYAQRGDTATWNNGDIFVMAVKGNNLANNFKFFKSGLTSTTCKYFDKDFNEVLPGNVQNNTWYYAVCQFDTVQWGGARGGGFYGVTVGENVYIGKAFILGQDEKDLFDLSSTVKTIEGAKFGYLMTNLKASGWFTLSDDYKITKSGSYYTVGTKTGAGNTEDIDKVSVVTWGDYYAVLKVKFDSSADLTKIKGFKTQMNGSSYAGAVISYPEFSYYDTQFKKLDGPVKDQWIYAVVKLDDLQGTTAGFEMGGQTMLVEDAWYLTPTQYAQTFTE